MDRPRLPYVNSDEGSWGNILNEFLQQIHTDHGLLKDGSVTKLNLETIVKDSLDKADSSVQSVNAVSPVSGNVTLDAGLVGAVPASEKGTNNGVAQLDNSGKLPLAQVPDPVALKVATTVDAVGDYGLSTTATATDNGTALLTAVQAANGRPVYIREGDYPCEATFTDEDIHIVGPGRLLHEQASTVITVTRSTSGVVPISSISTVQFGTNVADNATPVEFATRIDAQNSQAYANGDLLLLASQDEYGQDFLGSGGKTYKAEYAPVHGLGLKVSTPQNGGVTVNNTVVGATSGATGIVKAISLTTPSGNVLVFDKVSGAFQNGETLLIGGQAKETVSGSLFVIMAGRLTDTLTTSPQLWKVTSGKKLKLDISIAAQGDVNSIVGAANRNPGVTLQNVANAEIKLSVDRTWDRALYLSNCYSCDVDVIARNLPSNASTSEQGYGYGVEIRGTTQACRIKVLATNLRHAVTTNASNNSVFSNVLPTLIGIPKHNLIHDSIAYGVYSAGFDTHPGAYGTRFENCHVINTLGAGRTLTASAGFQNRGWNTTYSNCSAFNVVRGFIDLIGQWGNPPILPSNTTYNSCSVMNYQRTGYEIFTGVTQTNARVIYNFCEAIGDGSAINAPYYQAGWRMKGSNVNLYSCVSRRFSATPFYITSAGGRASMINCIADYSEGPSTLNAMTGFRLDAAPERLDLFGYKIRLHDSVNVADSAIRVNGAGVAVTVYTDGVIPLNNSLPTFKRETAGATLTVNVVSPITA